MGDDIEETLPKSRDSKPKLKKSKQLSEKKLKRLQEAHERRGVIYISRIPPNLRPQKLRQLLEQHAKIGRIYLAPEDPLVRKKRKQQGGSSGKKFTEGWVEFEDKSDAKSLVSLLNGQQMGGKKHNVHYYDLWCMKYLPRFKWDHLTEEINYQRAVHDQKLQAEISAAKRERDFYLSRVDKAKAVDAITERKRKKNSIGDGGGDDDDDIKNKKKTNTIEDGISGGPRVTRTFGQKRAKADPVTDGDAVLSDSVLRLVAGKK